MGEPLQHYVPRFMLRRFSSGGERLAPAAVGLPAGAVSLEQLMALAITEDHTAQETALSRQQHNAAYVEQKIMPSMVSKTLIQRRKLWSCSA